MRSMAIFPEWMSLHQLSMFGMFNGATAFNGDISEWDVSSVFYLCPVLFSQRQRSMAIFPNGTSPPHDPLIMFNRTTAFNGDISKWDVLLSPFVCSMKQHQPIYSKQTLSLTAYANVSRCSDSVQWRYFQMGRLFRHRHNTSSTKRSMAIFPNGTSLPSPTCLNVHGANSGSMGCLFRHVEPYVPEANSVQWLLFPNGTSFLAHPVLYVS
jgi:hypothetical protein